MFPQRRLVFVKKSPVFLFSVLALSNVSMWSCAKSPATYKQYTLELHINGALMYRKGEPAHVTEDPTASEYVYWG